MTLGVGCVDRVIVVDRIDMVSWYIDVRCPTIVDFYTNF